MTRLHRGLLGLFMIVVGHSTAMGQFGATLTGIGPINRSMGGASTAAPLDTLGAFQWNPATITALPSSTDFGLEILMPHSSLASRIDAGSLGGGFPGVTLAGVDDSQVGVYPLPEFGVVYQPKDSAVSLGLGVLSVGGFGVNYPGSSTNPILGPPLPNGFGVGPIYTQYQLMQVVPTVAFQLTDQLSVGVSPIIDLASLSADPGILASPDGASGSGYPSYPAMNHGSFQWGAGFQVGAYYKIDDAWQVGASFKSTQWFKDFDYNSQDQIGAPRRLQYGLDAPMIVSVGTAYTGIDRLLLAVDGRFLNYSETRGFSDSGYDGTGAVTGLGWKDIFALSAGTQYRMTDAASVRLGYSYNTNPISDDQAFFNIGSPLLIQHGAYLGGSYNVTERFKVSLAYSHFFDNSVSGPIQSPLGPIAGTSVTSHASADAITAGASFTY